MQKGCYLVLFLQKIIWDNFILGPGSSLFVRLELTRKSIANLLEPSWSCKSESTSITALSWKLISCKTPEEIKNFLLGKRMTDEEVTLFVSGLEDQQGQINYKGMCEVWY